MQIKLFANLQLPEVGRQTEIILGDGTTVADALEALFAKVPALREMILQPDGRTLQPHVNILLKGRLIRDLQGLDTPVKESDALAIFPPVAGG